MYMIATYISAGLQIVTNNHSKCTYKVIKPKQSLTHVLGTIIQNSKNFSSETDIKENVLKLQIKVKINAERERERERERNIIHQTKERKSVSSSCALLPFGHFSNPLL